MGRARALIRSVARPRDVRRDVVVRRHGTHLEGARGRGAVLLEKSSELQDAVEYSPAELEQLRILQDREQKLYLFDRCRRELRQVHLALTGCVLREEKEQRPTPRGPRNFSGRTTRCSLASAERFSPRQEHRAERPMRLQRRPRRRRGWPARGRPRFPKLSRHSRECSHRDRPSRRPGPPNRRTPKPYRLRPLPLGRWPLCAGGGDFDKTGTWPRFRERDVSISSKEPTKKPWLHLPLPNVDEWSPSVDQQSLRKHQFVQQVLALSSSALLHRSRHQWPAPTLQSRTASGLNVLRASRFAIEHSSRTSPRREPWSVIWARQVTVAATSPETSLEARRRCPWIL
jgi:hypothetical protein